MRKNLGGTAVALLLGGCTTIPAVTASYYYPQAKTAVTVTQTIGCNDDASVLKSISTISSTTVYVADLRPSGSTSKIPQGSIRLDRFGGLLSDASPSLTFTNDGRLSGINVGTTGQASSILKAASGLITTSSVALLGDQIALTNPLAGACTAIKQYSAGSAVAQKGAGGAPADTSKAPTVATLTYTLPLHYDQIENHNVQLASDALGSDAQSSGELSILPDADSVPFLNALNAALPSDYPKVGYKITLASSQRLDGAAKGAVGADDQAVSLNQVSLAHLTVSGPTGDLKSNQVLWAQDVPVPLREYYQLPLPKGRPFGGLQFSLALADSGAITKLGYTSSSGAADVINTATGVVTALAGPTDAERASVVQSQSDLVYQQQRFIICTTKPAVCPSK